MSSQQNDPQPQKLRIGHEHPDVTGGWLRPAVFGAMDGLVSNAALIAGVAGGTGALESKAVSWRASPGSRRAPSPWRPGSTPR